MINKTTIENTLYKVVGFRQPYNPEYAVLDADNLTSRSGYYVNDNALAKIEFVFDNADYYNMSSVQKNEFLKTLQKSAISNVMNQVFDNSDFISRNWLFENAQTFNNVESLPTQFVGYKVCKTNEPYVATKISKIRVAFKESTSIKLLCFELGRIAPLYTKQISNVTISEVELNWELKNREYYIGYIASGQQPYKRDYDNSNCMSEYKFTDLTPITVGSTSEAVIFDASKTENTSDYYGMNFDIMEYYEYTDMVLANESMFSQAIYLQCIILIIQNCIASIRSNKTERISQDVINKMIAEIDGMDGENSVIKKVGLKSLLFGEIKGLQKEINRLKGQMRPLGIQLMSLS